MLQKDSSWWAKADLSDLTDLFTDKSMPSVIQILQLVCENLVSLWFQQMVILIMKLLKFNKIGELFNPHHMLLKT